MKTTTRRNEVRLPRLLAAPFSLLPGTAGSRVMALALNRALAEPLREGELDFLRNRSIEIAVRDAGMVFRLTYTGGRLGAVARSGTADLVIAGTVYDFLALVSRQEDPDTLVFQRRLVMQGDTELGLQVKNFLDGLDPESLGLPGKLEPFLKNVLSVYQRAFG
ncbi:MAG TPA: sterol-binding protein [Gammaproteobacteria bacterium]|nr:sterol-binding protein [Gammaproteobacteria bacterium]